VLDQSPISEGMTGARALHNSLALAQHADGLGYHRYWVAEHHNLPSIASSAPDIMIGQIAAATSRMRVGSGGVMLPNHAPLMVAERFKVLEALFPGRIDLGLGRDEHLLADDADHAVNLADPIAVRSAAEGGCQIVPAGVTTLLLPGEAGGLGGRQTEVIQGWKGPLRVRGQTCGQNAHRRALPRFLRFLGHRTQSCRICRLGTGIEILRLPARRSQLNEDAVNVTLEFPYPDADWLLSGLRCHRLRQQGRRTT